MFAAVKAAIGDIDADAVVRPVQCLSVCKRPVTVAVSSADGYTFLFGDLETESGTAALTSFVASYRTSDYGLVPWRERAEVLRKGMVARVPPMAWSPDDGRAPNARPAST
jgi:predicted metal-binding protein